jgi:hypothetical protein
MHNNQKINYSFSKSRTGEIVPIICSPQGDNPLHSMIDPVREAQRIISSVAQEGFFIILGLGGGFIAKAALEQTEAQITVIDFDKNSINQLFANSDYSILLKNYRFNLLLDPSFEDIKAFIIEHYKPALYGGIKTIPLRARIEQNKTLFDSVISTIQEAIELVSGDYSVQAHFGKRMFSNIIRNLYKSGNFNLCSKNDKNILPGNKDIDNAAIVAAGPSLDIQLPYLQEFKKNGGVIICTDTSFPVLIHAKITPDIIVSIDCQFIGYYHFINLNLHYPVDIPIILDITSPPVLSGFTSKPFFFSGGHPLTRYISRTWKPIPFLDTSGGNVTYACLSVAEYLGARHITLFGADFSYIKSRSYARGTYIYPYFNNRQNRFSPLEGLFSKFLYRTPFFPTAEDKKKNYYETSSLRFYRKKFEEKASRMSAEIICAKGLGAPVVISKIQKAEKKEQETIAKEQSLVCSGNEFLKQYRDDIFSLPKINDKENYIKKLNPKELQIFTTLLPYMAAIKKRNPELTQIEIIEEVKRAGIAEIDNLLNRNSIILP